MNNRRVDRMIRELYSDPVLPFFQGISSLFGAPEAATPAPGRARADPSQARAQRSTIAEELDEIATHS